ncbi:MAG: hypothetical protein K9K65_06265 [Desulfarculaceae bacterium]|nr:hypothetical protein [Desulfarculaceae bacterium]MCF8047866.1 hypothetical protein [Desulfarculaceae bacterium]MCF8065415.1 hypothetical protein [Desulfarculaceae bacterium]MCF8097430.1 hypothetical protein [Desulfarculaceae bacterium]
MRLVTVGGFLGAGKTSLLQGLARWWGEQGQRLLVLENEAGQVGLDDRLLRDLSLEVRLLPGGCACCDLQGVLVDKLKQALEEDSWDLVLLEPSGVASLASLGQVLERYVPELGQGITATVVDASRHATMTKALPKLLADHLAASSQVVLSKADLMPAEEVKRIGAQLRLGAPQAQVWPVDLRGTGAYELAREVAPRLLASETTPDLASTTAGDGPHQAQSYALNLPENGLSHQAAKSLVGSIIAALPAPGQDWLGHVKLWGEDASGGHLLASGTTAQDVSSRGDSSGSLTGRAWLVVISHQPLPPDLDETLYRLLTQAAPGACLEPVRSAPSLFSLGSLGQPKA